MRSLLITLLPLALVCMTTTAAAQSDAALERARRVLRDAPLADTHNDLPWAIRNSRTAPMNVEAYDLRRTTAGQTDLRRLAEGQVRVQWWSVYVPGEKEYREKGYAKTQLEQLDIATRMIARYPDRLCYAESSADIDRCLQQGKIASLLGMEGGHVIENSLALLRMYHALGARYMTLTHNVTLDWADAATDTARHGGLTPFGRDVVREMNRLGMMVDLSHVSPAVMRDAIATSRVPVVFTHSSARAVTDHPRNVPDDVLRLLPKNGGVVQVTFVPQFVSTRVMQHDRALAALRTQWKREGVTDEVRTQREAAWRAANPGPKASIADVADHIEHVRKVAGIDHVGIGGDFDGIDTTPVGLEDVSTYPALFAELVRRGWTDEELAKLAGGNVLRVFRAVEAGAGK